MIWLSMAVVSFGAAVFACALKIKDLEEAARKNKIAIESLRKEYIESECKSIEWGKALHLRIRTLEMEEDR